MTMNAMALNAGNDSTRANIKVAPESMVSRIGDLAGQFGITLRALRFYEDKGLIKPQRNGTTRLYDYRDRARLKLILLGPRLAFHCAKSNSCLIFMTHPAPTPRSCVPHSTRRRSSSRSSSPSAMRSMRRLRKSRS